MIPNGDPRGQKRAASIPVKRLGRSDDVARVVMFFADRGNSFVGRRCMSGSAISQQPHYLRRWLSVYMLHFPEHKMRGWPRSPIGAMSGGFATPTESAALGAIATMGLAAAYRALSLRALMAALRGTVTISAMILFIILRATTFSQILSFSGASDGIVTGISAMASRRRRS